MLGYDGTDASEDIDTNKTSRSCECIICHYWDFPRINFRLQQSMQWLS